MTPSNPDTPVSAPEPAKASEETKDRYRRTVDLVLADRGDKKPEYNLKAKATIQLMREVLPNLDDNSIFVIFSSVSYMLSSLMMTPLAKVGDDLEDMFDVYALASAALLGVYDLGDESPAPTKAEQREKAMAEEIEKLREQLAKGSDDDAPPPGLYL